MGIFYSQKNKRPCRTLQQGFEKYVLKRPEGCWEWNGIKNKQCYGMYFYKNRQILAHRGSWMIFFGEIPEGLCVLHKCDNASCTNPDHLFLGTRTDNARDMILKKRSPVLHQKGEKNPRSKLSDSDRDKIKALLAESKKQRDIANIFNISHKLVSRINCDEKRKGGIL